MNCPETSEAHKAVEASECELYVPLGLLGFERFKRFTLSTRPEEEPFLRFRAVDDPKLTFLVISPFLALPSYRPQLSEEDVEFLEIADPENQLIFNIVTLRGPQQATVNLKGPIVLNRQTLRAKQVIPVNASEFSVAHPLPLAT